MCDRAKLKRNISRDNSSVITSRYMPCMCMALYKQLKLALLGRSFGVQLYWERVNALCRSQVEVYEVRGVPVGGMFLGCCVQ